ncbi:MAG TPA: ATP-binding protein [Acidisarcina sp.]|nr:ATP-binding protein [Acidisarcina sp.]
MNFWKPRTIRSQLIAGLIVTESILLLSFAIALVRQQTTEIRHRAQLRLNSKASVLASQAAPLLTSGQFDTLQLIVNTIMDTSSVHAAQVTDANGRTVASSDSTSNGLYVLSPSERQHLHPMHDPESFRTAIDPENQDIGEAVAPIMADGKLIGFAWIYEDTAPDHQQVSSLLRITSLYALCAILASVLVALVMAQSITRPLAVLREGTRQLMRDPSSHHRFPLPVLSSNEASDLTTAFNLMVSSMDEQRSGLNDTLALLDSMLANAPTGFGFFDRKCHYVRINGFLADLNGLPISRQLGKSPSELIPTPASFQIEELIRQVFSTGTAIQDVELSTELPREPGTTRHWLINLYPVRTGLQPVRWVGAIIVDTTERIRSEEALRKTEKLAAVGRLAASIAHEINNPLEAVTNLLYLLHMNSSLDRDATRYAEMAQHEVARVSEITQQTLRFYRQSTLPVFSNVPDLIDSVLSLHQGRMNGFNIEVKRNYRPGGELFCFAGEMRQLFANLVGNAVDAMQTGGQLAVEVRRSRSWRDPAVKGVRIFVADTGSGMDASVRKHIFEPFFTTKEVTGTGLGLWVSAEIIQKHDGIVMVRSRPASSGKPSGTVFMLFFPERMLDAKVDEQIIEGQMESRSNT